MRISEVEVNFLMGNIAQMCGVEADAERLNFIEKVVQTGNSLSAPYVHRLKSNLAALGTPHARQHFREVSALTTK